MSSLVADHLNRITFIDQLTFTFQFIITGIDDIQYITGIPDDICCQNIIEIGQAVPHRSHFGISTDLIEFIIQFFKSRGNIFPMVSLSIIDRYRRLFYFFLSVDLPAIFKVTFVIIRFRNIILVNVGNDILQHFLINQQLSVYIYLPDPISFRLQQDFEVGFILYFIYFDIL